MIPRSVHVLIFQIINWFKSYQQAYEKINPPAYYRIIDIHKNQKHETRLTVQRIGKATVFECSPISIAQDEQLHESFSKADVRTITFLAQQALTAPKYAIVAQLFEDEHTVFRLQKIGMSDYIEKSASDITKDKQIMASLSSSDAHMVGYVDASEKVYADLLTIPNFNMLG